MNMQGIKLNYWNSLFYYLKKKQFKKQLDKKNYQYDWRTIKKVLKIVLIKKEMLILSNSNQIQIPNSRNHLVEWNCKLGKSTFMRELFDWLNISFESINIDNYNNLTLHGGFSKDAMNE